MANRIATIIRMGVEKAVETLAARNRRRLPARDHLFLSGVHRPMGQELTLEEYELSVEGVVPPALDGRYLRIGPNPINPHPASYHWFTGDGMVHGLAIRDGRALWYRNRWIRSEQVADALAVMPAPGPRHMFDTVNTNVLKIAGRTYALVEGGSYPVALSDTLDEQRYDPLGGTLLGSFSAHPHLDPLTGEHHAICWEGRRPQEIRHVVVDSTGQVVREEPISVDHGPMIHDCAITSRYVVILDLPVTLSLATLVAGHALPYAWNPRHKARVGLMPRNGSQADIIWCPVDPVFVFHFVNAYDLPDGRVILDVCSYPSMFTSHSGGPDTKSRGLERWTINPATRGVDIETIDPSPQEFPRCDERLFGQHYRYAYSMAAGDGVRFEIEGRIYKHDLESRSRESHNFGAGRIPGEFVFVPSHLQATEDEGWLIGLVVDEASDTTSLEIINAQDFAGPPVACISLPHRIPPGFHGNWIAN